MLLYENFLTFIKIFAFLDKMSYLHNFFELNTIKQIQGKSLYEIRSLGSN